LQYHGAELVKLQKAHIRQSGISPKKNQESASQKSAQPTFNNVLSKPAKGITALYERLSREDGEDGISNSITN